MTHGIGLRQNAAEGVAQHQELRQPQVLSRPLDVCHVIRV
jgi:hypothetical protein